MQRPLLDLKVRLTLRVAAVAALCLLAASIDRLVGTREALAARAAEIAATVARSLVLQQDQMRWVKPAPEDFPDLQRLAPALEEPGLCIGFRGPDGRMVQRLCDAAPPEDEDVPAAFAWLNRAVFGTSREAALPVVFGGRTVGEAVAEIDPRLVAADVWRETSRLAGALAVAFVGLCLLVYAALARALRPTRAISVAMQRLAAGDLCCRLPTFDLAELSAVSVVFNQLGADLEAALRERDLLTQRLLAVQEDERKHLARELHDEFGQYLTAICAASAAAESAARREFPAIAADCALIGHSAARLMDLLRGALARLRAPDVQDLGLAACLENLVASWNRVSAAQFSLTWEGAVDALPDDLAAVLFRVAQEAMTNAAKHASAAHVRMRLAVVADRAMRAVELSVDDDGLGPCCSFSSPGLGLPAMQERVQALGGTVLLRAETGKGFGLTVHIPLPADSVPCAA